MPALGPLLRAGYLSYGKYDFPMPHNSAPSEPNEIVFGARDYATERCPCKFPLPLLGVKYKIYNEQLACLLTADNEFVSFEICFLHEPASLEYG